ncbi:hypothetical protein [Actinacidiphila acididurans]|uniref:Uncharacterized protein n=1 Tax=Actinacidiphila acididurans TaxID=2784346 RepID=A0ABS2TNA7_9ACTN|nr:hypothetical protein [Actinacidiphila acididurans]MBM9504567.1 hypothetical protein [Actinacidiphila acididurans]
MVTARNERGWSVRRPGPTAVSTLVAGLGRGNSFLILERDDEDLEGNWYIQVRLRDNNTYQLEYRDGTAAHHYQTQTVSQTEACLEPSWPWALLPPSVHRYRYPSLKVVPDQ